MVIRAPATGTVVKFTLLPGEQYAPGATAVSFYSPDMKITADISELNIGRINVGANPMVHIALDAFPDQTFTGKVTSIEPQEIDKDGDKYYRVNMAFNQTPPDVRSGMSADLDIILQTKESAIRIPEFLVYSRADGKYVKRMIDGTPTEQRVTLGISDGENIEVVSGLNEGDVITAN
jgi:multidrug efflux pump subunit AcrA (membrane-fusion protein)